VAGRGFWRVFRSPGVHKTLIRASRAAATHDDRAECSEGGHLSQRTDRARATGYGSLSGRYGASRSMAPTNWASRLWPSSWRTAEASPM
jgi:hypothetical protein